MFILYPFIRTRRNNTARSVRVPVDRSTICQEKESRSFLHEKGEWIPFVEKDQLVLRENEYCFT